MGAEFGTNDVILKVKAAAQSTVPSDPHFAFLGTPGAPVWILPKVQDENLLYLGYGGDGIPTNVFVGDQVQVALKTVTGPGKFFSYDFDTFGSPKVLFNSADGISTNDVAVIHSGGDAHLNWAFTQPGDYQVALEVSGTLVAGNKSTSSGPVTFTFSVGDGPKILSTGHTDLSIVYTADTDAWDVHVGSDTFMEEYDADDTILQVKPVAQTTITNDVKFAFLGNPGDPLQAAYDPANLLQLLVFDVNHTIGYKSNEVDLVIAEGAKTTLPAGTPFGAEGASLWIIPANKTKTRRFFRVQAH